MRDYTLYIAASYGFTAVVLGGVTLYTILVYRQARKALALLEQRQEKP